ncbi:MAG TPA: hypothetical protein VER55_07985 [Ardenticatenaceae bacterium]|nr:hypothetical protein [Ardenticatenaceae bacterium]
MTENLAAVIKQVDALSLQERQELFAYLQEELEDADDVRVARERMARLASGETLTYSVEEVWAELTAEESSESLRG